MISGVSSNALRKSAMQVEIAIPTRVPTVSVNNALNICLVSAVMVASDIQTSGRMSGAIIIAPIITAGLF